MNDEVWKPAPGYEVWLEISDHGGARTLDYLAPSSRALQPIQLRRGVTLKPDASGATGYPRVVLKRHGKVYRLDVHRLVALAFVPGYFDGATVDHIDGCRTNNLAANLRWMSRADNTRSQNLDGRGVGRGEKHPSSRLRDADVPHLFALREAGWSLSEIGAQFGVSGSLVHKITTGIRRNHQTSP